ncbi:DoxX family protein [Paenibacillus sp. RC67]|uniref:DoxX family protein n=1 Tax=Paenibacillus sp. RC67 TaxID=3039392 RepID=UPI0024AE63D0|nr:DoxX family protein [Paenibacillus sp. RC67]
MSKGSIIITLIRILFGAMFMAHGISKLQMGLSNVAGWFNSIGLPGQLGYVVAFLELIGGVLLIAGLATRYISIAYIILMAGAIISTKLPMGLLGDGKAPGFELELAYMLIALFLTVEPHKGWGLDRLFGRTANSTN